MRDTKQVGRKFIPLLSRDGTLLVVDQHAAHERVRLEHLTHILLREGAATTAAARTGSSTVASGSGAGAQPSTDLGLPGKPGAVQGKAGGKREEHAGTGVGAWAAHAAGPELAAAGAGGVGLGDTAAALGRQAVQPPMQVPLAAHEAAALHRHRAAVAGWGWVVREEEDTSGREGGSGAGVAVGAGAATWGGSSVAVLAVPTVLGVALSCASEIKVSTLQPNWC